MPLTESGIGFNPKIIEEIEKDLRIKREAPLPSFGHPIEMMEKPNLEDKPDFQFLKKVNIPRNSFLYFNNVNYFLSGMANKTVDLYQISNNLLGAMIDEQLKAVFAKKDYEQCKKMHIGTPSNKWRLVNLNMELTDIVDLSKTTLNGLLDQRKITHEQYNTIVEFQHSGQEVAKRKLLDKIYQTQEQDPSPLLAKEITDFLIISKDKGFPIEDLKQFADNLPNYNKLRDQDLAILEQNGLIERKIHNGKQIIVADLDKIKDISIHSILKIGGGTQTNKNISIYNSQYYGRGNQLLTISYLFLDGIVSQKDYQKALDRGNDPKPIPLFYYPKNLSDAIDPEKIKKSKFYFGFWELSRNMSTQSMSKIFDPEQNINPSEAAFICLIFHPKYGNGRRNKQGKLEIFNIKNGEYQLFSFNYLSKQFHVLQRELMQGIQFVHEHCRNLLNHRVIRLEDFNVSQKETKKMFRRDAKISPSGDFVLDRVKYYVKRDSYLHINALATKINDTLGCVYDINTCQILYTFPLQKTEELEKDPIKYSNSYGKSIKSSKVYGLGKELSKVEKFDESEFLKQKSDETFQEYNQRVRDYKYLKLELDLIKATKDQNLLFSFREISPDIKTLIKNDPDNLRELGIERLIRFTHKFGKSGFELLSVLEHLGKQGRILLSMVEKLNNTQSAKEFIDKLHNSIFISFLDLNKIVATVSNNNLTLDQNIATKLSQFIEFSCIEFDRNQNTTIDDINSKIQIAKHPFDLDHISDSMTEKTAQLLSNHYGAETAKDLLDQLHQNLDTDTGLKDKINQLIVYINPEAPQEVLHDLRQLYEKIRFEKYKLNEQMLKNEIGLLQKNLLGNPKTTGSVIDSGCGTGRFLIPLNKIGYDISGIDYTQRHVDLLNHQYPNIKVEQGDWTNLSNVATNSFNEYICMGRNILHEYQTHRQHKLFSEANRVLKKGGKLIFDIPNCEKGHYKQLIGMYTQTMHRRGITNFRPGTIYDSPDGINFLTRYVYSHDDIVDLAQSNGFKIVKIEKQVLENGHGDENIYYVLEKVANVE
ncbi:MAG: methyltransferase type 11 [uncultured bacterium]|nr:MAG: methyltransferase type 11 [uncultured bacterium]